MNVIFIIGSVSLFVRVILIVILNSFAHKIVKSKNVLLLYSCSFVIELSYSATIANFFALRNNYFSSFGVLFP